MTLSYSILQTETWLDTQAYDAIRKAVETIDSCAAKVTQVARKMGYTVLILPITGMQTMLSILTALPTPPTL